jgi:hypothetical protein
MAKNRNPVSLAADRASKVFCSAAERAEDNPARSNIQSPPCRIISREGKARRQRPPASVPDRNGEARIQASIVEWIRTVAPNVLVFHVPNGGRRSKAEAARLKWTGVVAGVPDLCVIGPGGKALFLEVKTATGRLSDEQREIMGALGRLGSPFMTVTSIDDVRRAFSGWGIETREVAR